MSPRPSITEKGVRCPGCWGRDTRTSYHRGIRDSLAAIFSLAPMRCRACGRRFYRRRGTLVEVSGIETQVEPGPAE